MRTTARKLPAPALLTYLSSTSPNRRRPPVFAVLALLTFAIAPHWLLPSGGGRELVWSWWQQAAGDSYALIGLAVLTQAAIKNLLLRPKPWDPGTAEHQAGRAVSPRAGLGGPAGFSLRHLGPAHDG